MAERVITTYADVVAGLHERFATIPEIADPKKQILDYEPETVLIYPTIYSLFDRVTPTIAAGLVKLEYRILHRVLFKWKSAQEAERLLKPFVDSMIACVEADPFLGLGDREGLAPYAEMGQGIGVFVDIGGLQRAIEFTSSTIVKRPYGGAPL